MIDKYDAPIYTCDFEWGANKEVVGEKMAELAGAYHGVFIPFLTDEVTGFGAMYKDSFNNPGAKDLGEKFTNYISNFLWSGNPNGQNLVQSEWKPWTGANKGATQLKFNADKNKASITMSEDRIKYEDILKEMEADTTVSKEVKDKIIKEVLNGRWFSKGLDEYFQNSSLWIK